MWMVLVKCVVMYFLVILSVRLMGKRQIGELQPSELVITIMISELAAMPLQSEETTLQEAAIPIFAFMGLEILISFITLKSVKARSFLYGHPLILIYKGQFRQREMKRARVTVDDIMEIMRNQGIATIEDVDYAILETNGQLSIIKKQKNSGGLPRFLIIDGRVMSRNLKESGHDLGWLLQQLSNNNITSPKEVFIMTVDDTEEIYLVLKTKK